MGVLVVVAVLMAVCLFMLEVAPEGGWVERWLTTGTSRGRPSYRKEEKMKKLSLLASVATAVVLVLASYASVGSAASPTFRLSAVLTVAQEVPHAKGAMSGAAGHFTATLTNGTLKWHLTFSHLTGRATASHIHVGVKGKSGQVLVSLCGPCKSGTSGTEKLPNPAAFTVEKHGATYVNVHTAKNPNGEIRGQLIVAP